MESATAATTSKSDAAKASAKSDAAKASATTKTNAPTKANAPTEVTWGSATDESATAPASDVADHGAGVGVGDSAAATGATGDRDRDAAVTAETADPKGGRPQSADPKSADPKGGRPQSADAKSADPKGPDAKSADAKSADAQTSVESAQADVADSVPVDIAAPDTEDTDDAAAVAEATRPIRAGASAPEGRKDAGHATAPDHTGAKQVTVVPGVPRYHTANCILIRFMGDDDVQKMTVPEATATGCTPCRACQPDSEAE
jgi:hypothetical protein